MPVEDKEISQLDELFAADVADLLCIVDISANETKKITFENLFADFVPYSGAAADLDLGVYSLYASNAEISGTLSGDVKLGGDPALEVFGNTNPGVSTAKFYWGCQPIVYIGDLDTYDSFDIFSVGGVFQLAFAPYNESFGAKYYYNSVPYMEFFDLYGDLLGVPAVLAMTEGITQLIFCDSTYSVNALVGLINSADGYSVADTPGYSGPLNDSASNKIADVVGGIITAVYY